MDCYCRDEIHVNPVMPYRENVSAYEVTLVTDEAGEGSTFLLIAEECVHWTEENAGIPGVCAVVEFDQLTHRVSYILSSQAYILDHNDIQQDPETGVFQMRIKQIPMKTVTYRLPNDEGFVWYSIDQMGRLLSGG